MKKEDLGRFQVNISSFTGAWKSSSLTYHIGFLKVNELCIAKTRDSEVAIGESNSGALFIASNASSRTVK